MTAENLQAVRLELGSVVRLELEESCVPLELVPNRVLLHTADAVSRTHQACIGLNAVRLRVQFASARREPVTYDGEPVTYDGEPVYLLVLD